MQSDCGGDATLGFGAGLSNPDDPDVYLRDFTGRTRVWIEVGQPEEKPIGKANVWRYQVLALQSCRWSAVMISFRPMEDR